MYMTKKKQTQNDLGFEGLALESVDKYEFEYQPIQGYPELRWTGKRPFRSTQYYPAQLKEQHGEPEDGWLNRIYWGDNLQVMSHLLKEFRGKVNLIYIDPPFDSKADYKKKIKLRGHEVENDYTAFEEKQYTDIWTNDEYLQFMYERLILMRELLADDGSIFVHCDWRANSYLRLIIDEVFGEGRHVNEIIWCYSIGGKGNNQYARKHDTIYYYSKSSRRIFNGRDPLVVVERKPNSHMRLKKDDDGRFYQEKTDKKSGKVYRYYVDEGKIPEDYWTDIEQLNREDSERISYPTQKPERLIARIIAGSSNPGDIVFDCFMGSGTTQAVAMKLGRRFIGADINLGSIQTTTARLLNVATQINGDEISAQQQAIEFEDSSDEIEIGQENIDKYYTGFSVYNVNYYDVFRNPLEACSLLLEALEIQPLPAGSLFDGEKDGRLVKIMPVNHIATRADLNELIAGFNYKEFERRRDEHPNKPVESILLVCMGHEPELKAQLEIATGFKLDVDVIDILRDKANLEFKRDSEAKITRENDKLIIESFYPLNLLQKLGLMDEQVDDWRELVESIMIDWDYDGHVLKPTVIDIPGKNEMVKGEYFIPDEVGIIRIKITDLLSESLEVEV